MEWAFLRAKVAHCIYRVSLAGDQNPLLAFGSERYGTLGRIGNVSFFLNTLQHLALCLELRYVSACFGFDRI